MAMLNRPVVERSAAAGIVLLAVVLAWMIVDRPDEALPQKITVEPAPKPEPPHHADAPSTAAIAAALAVELVEIAAPPPPPTVSVPPPMRVAPAPAPVETPPPPQVAVRDIPPTPPSPVQELVPLRPTPAPVPQAVPAVLRREPEPIEARNIVPLKPTPPQVKPEPPVVQRPAPREEKIEPDVTPLRPTPAKPPREPEVIRVKTPPAPPSPQPPAKPAPAAEPPKPSPAMNVATVMGEGRAFLKILEQGAGPGIEIRWPSEPAQRDRLYGALVKCLGMRTGLLDASGRLYLEEGQKGQPSTLDGERYSGFVRRPEGAIAREEEREIARVRGYHQVAAGASAARIFPRRVDAYLIGGLRALVGDTYLKTKSIRASYRLKNGEPVVDSIVADGRRIDGSVDLSAVANSCPA